MAELDIQDLISSGVSRWMLYGILVQGLNWTGLWQAQQGQDPEELLLAARKCTGNARWVLVAAYLSKFTKEECQSPRGLQKVLDKINGNEDEKQIQRSEWLVKIEGQVEKAIPLIVQTQDVRFKRMVSSISWLIRNISDQGVQRWLRVCKMMPQECYGACYHCVGEEFLEGIQKIELGRDLTKEYIIWMTNGRINEKYFVPYCRKDMDMFMEVINEGNIWDSKNLLKALKIAGKNEQLEILANEGVERFVEEVRKVNSEYANLLFDFIRGKTDGSEWWNKLQKYSDSKWRGSNIEEIMFNRYRQIHDLDETGVKMHMWMWKTLPGYATS
ncbi:MAG: hypothetical protein IJ315_01300 [Firmicutes bacterium]|nr:hypothetical protein [Bacillota bacterium]